jgi:glucose/arabinose dehydrogenase
MRRLHLALLALAVSACSGLAPSIVPEPTVPPSPTVHVLQAATPTEPSQVSAVPETAPTPQFPNPEEYSWSLEAEGFQQSLDLKHADDHRLFVVEKPGTVRVLEGSILQPEPFLDIRDRIRSSGSEQGLLGLAFHPSFTTNGFFYVYYTDLNGDTVVSRFRLSADAGHGDPASEFLMLQVSQPHANHNGGSMAFGPDGRLYVGLGDGGSAGDPQGNGQRLDTLLGKILRLDVDSAEPYAIPADNPFASGGGLPEIWAYGLRNPWRFSFDRETGDLFVGDVGQGEWEEIDYQPAGSPGGANFGWSFREGAHPFEGEAPAGLTDPIAEYSHAEGCSVTGGVVVRSPSLPEWNGVYLFGDFCSGLVWGLLRDADGRWQQQLLFDTGFAIASFGTDAQGEVYLADLNGAVYRLEAID